jgi:hypothetical protein
MVVNEAVTCRNHFVHGSPGSFDYDANFGAVCFLSNTLEFIFGCSDLIEAGWDISAWADSGTTMTHPFGAYRADYRHSLKKLEALLRIT